MCVSGGGARYGWWSAVLLAFDVEPRVRRIYKGTPAYIYQWHTPVKLLTYYTGNATAMTRASGQRLTHLTVTRGIQC